MPTDFSFVTPEGWEAMEPDFQKAEKKWSEKVKKKEIEQGTADKIVKLMWDKYENWSKGKGTKKKEDQTVVQRQEKGKAGPQEKKAMLKKADIGRGKLLDILDAMHDGTKWAHDTIDSELVFQQTLQLSNTNKQEFFDLFAKDVQEHPSKYSKNYMSGVADRFREWGYGPQMEIVLNAYRGAIARGPQAPGGKVSPLRSGPVIPPETPAAVPPASPGQAAPGKARSQYPVEPQPWPQGLEPKPSAEGGQRWYFVFQLPGDQNERAAIAEGLNPADAQEFLHSLRRNNVRVTQKPINLGQGMQSPAKGRPAAEAQKGTIETPDPSDPQKYLWLLKYKTPSGFVASPKDQSNYTGEEMQNHIKLITGPQFKCEIVELRKLGLSQESSMDDVIIRTANDGSQPEDAFKSGTPIIFTEDVNLEFDSISAHGQIKKNMTGRVKKVDDQNYTIDIAGQIYRVPKIVADAVMTEFMADVVVNDKELEDKGEAPAGQEGAAPQPGAQNPQAPTPKVQAPAQAPAQQAPGQSPDQLRGPKSRQQASQGGGVVVATVTLDDEMGSIVVSSLDIEAGKWTPQEVGFVPYKEPEPAYKPPVQEKLPALLSLLPKVPSMEVRKQVGTVGHAVLTRLYQAFQENSTEPSALAAMFKGMPTVEMYQITCDPEAMAYAMQLWKTLRGPVRSGAAGGGIVQVAAGMSARDVAAAFAEGNGMYPSSKSQNLFIKGDTIYSYGGHFPIATWVPGLGDRYTPTVYFTTKSYSASTTMHKGLVRMALEKKGVKIVESSNIEGGKVGAPTEADMAAQAKREQKQKARKVKVTEPPSQPQQKSLADDTVQSLTGTPSPETSPAEGKPGNKPIQQLPEKTKRRFNEEEMENAPSTPFDLTTMKPGQQQMMVDKLLDQYTKETDPEKKKQLEQRIRSVQAAIRAQMLRRAELVGIKELQEEVADKTREKFKIGDQDKDEKNLPVSEPFSRTNTKPREAATKSQAFADLLMMIEHDAPGVPSDMGRRLYRADGLISTHSGH